MGSLECDGVMSNSICAKMPEPPKEIEGLLSDYQDFWGSIFARSYQQCEQNPYGTNPIYMPALTKKEQDYIENITRRLHSSPEWKEYTKKCTQWAVLM